MAGDIVEQVNQSTTVHEQVSRCPTHGQWVLKAHGCDLCKFERALHPSGKAL